MAPSKKEIKEQAQAMISASDAGLFATTVSLAAIFLDQNPGSVRGWLDKGHALTCLYRYDDAVAAYEKALAMVTAEGDNPDGIYAALGHLERQRGDFDTASGFFRKQIESNPKDSGGHLFKAAIELQQGNAEASVATLQQAVYCDEGCRDEVQYSLGLALRSAGKLNEARTAFQKAIEISPDYAEAKVALKDVKSAIAAAG